MGIDNPVHLIFLAAVALLVLGPKRLPEVARSLGKGIREFREAMSDGSAMNDGSPGGFPHERHDGVPGTPVGGPMPAPAPTPAAASRSGAVSPPDAEVVEGRGPSTGAVPVDGGWGALHADIQDIPAAAGVAGKVDPAQPVRSVDAPGEG